MPDIETRLKNDAARWQQDTDRQAMDWSLPAAPHRRVLGGHVWHPVLAAAAVLVIGVAVAVYGIDRHHSAPHQPTAASGRHPTAQIDLDVVVVLERTTSQAGPPILGEVIATNHTGHTLRLGNCGGWIQVGLVNGQINAMPTIILPACPPATLQPGTTRIPISVITRYSGCTQSQHPTQQFPACLKSSRDVMPPLPPGTYTTEADINAPPDIRISPPLPIKVTLLK